MEGMDCPEKTDLRLSANVELACSDDSSIWTKKYTNVLIAD
jgi:hypothetical protein